MRSILVGVDGSPASDAALAWATGFARAAGAELVTATVFPNSAKASSGAVPGDGSGHGRSPRHLTLSGEGREALEEAYRQEAADLMVIGAPAGEWFPALHLEHLSHRLACHTDHPIAVVPVTAGAGALQLVLGIDGSPGSTAAVGWVANLPTALTGEVLIAFAVPRPPAPFLHAEASSGADRGPQDWIRPLALAGIEVTMPVVGSEPVETLIGLGDRPGAVIVIGGRPVDPGHPLRLGSVARRILDRARGPVIIVPPVARTDEPTSTLAARPTAGARGPSTLG